jgi:hypothetical protein
MGEKLNINVGRAAVFLSPSDELHDRAQQIPEPMLPSFWMIIIST